MKIFKASQPAPKVKLLFGITAFSCLSVQCQFFNEVKRENSPSDVSTGIEDYKLPNIDLSHWKVTIPEGEGKGGALSVEPPEILDYASNEKLKPYMYNDSITGALVFYTYPSGATTENTKYSRTELREQIVPGNDDENWTFAEGGRMKGTLSVPEISKNDQGEFHRTIVMQIHGRLSDEQRDLIGQKDNNAPPILKIYWHKGRIRVLSKKLKDPDASGTEILYTDAWKSDDGFNFSEDVGHEKFTVEIIASLGRMEIILNDKETVVYDGIDIEKWSAFQNYFKAGNYLSTTDDDAFSKVKFYNLDVSH